MKRTQPTRFEQTVVFLRTYLRNPKMLGAIVPSSRFVVDEVLRKVQWSEARVVIEYGPGAGTFTAEILHRMRPDGILVVIELNSAFVRFLRKNFVDPRLRVVEGSAGDVDRALAQLGHSSADYVISGIPFSTMPACERDDIINKTQKVLRPGGAFLVYQVSGAVGPHLQRAFSTVVRGFEPVNLIPLRLFYCVP